ncbi:hypothetical protein ACHAXA_007024 [Cyclostephanos tholiformis]|uniref:Uncharacterized protein n=1 Tax=Cyclostephanos tholiformis TaxID=382380 RepID=A0ABD3RRP8_9STRA
MDDPSGRAGIKFRDVCYALVSICLGIWAFVKVNSISGPAFEPILAACTNPEISSGDFARKTGYHEYEPLLGLGVFNFLVCLITQFLLELRTTYPSGFLTWGGVIVVSLPLVLSQTLSAGRRGARGPVRYPTAIGLLAQLLGISVIFPLISNPSQIYSLGGPGVPVTNVRVWVGLIMAFPGVILSYLVFHAAPTDSYAWTASAGFLGGPLLAMMGLALWTDKSITMEASAENITRSSGCIQRAYSILALLSLVLWFCLVFVAHQSYGFNLNELWRDIWIEAGPSVAFMTVDTGVLYLGALLNIAYLSEWVAIKALVVTPFIGPGAACCMALIDIEKAAANALIFAGDEKKFV